MSTSKTLVAPAAYQLTRTPLPFARGTFYRWEKAGLIKLVRVGGKTLISAETVDRILSGEIALPSNHGRTKTPQPIDRGGHAKRLRPKPSADAAE